jgi:hypothetical protein
VVIVTGKVFVKEEVVDGVAALVRAQRDISQTESQFLEMEEP